MKLTEARNQAVQIVAVVMTIITALAATDPSVIAFLQQYAGSAKWAAAVLIVISFSQRVVALRAHKVNPDGTPATEPFVKDDKQ